MKTYTKILFRIALITLFACFFIKTTLFYSLCGALDFFRNKSRDAHMAKRYFLDCLFLLAPLNLLVDVLAWSQKATYTLDELPKDYQKEINHLIQNSHKERLIKALNDQMNDKKRGMIFFKWYGKNIKASIDIPDFHHNFKYIKTIGVSVFNKQQSTSRHFGPLRTTLRVLYNLTPTDDQGVYIVVDGHKHLWHDNPLFIFDDTYLHQSVNHSDQLRYCLFIDIVRPTLFSYPLMNTIINGIQVVMSKLRMVFYQGWDVI